MGKNRGAQEGNPKERKVLKSVKKENGGEAANSLKEDLKSEKKM